MNQSSLAAWMERALPELLPAFLMQRRWFAAKARPVASVEFEDAAWLPDNRQPCAIVVIRVRHTEDEQSRYALVLVFDSEAGTLPIIGRVEQAPEPTWAIEAATDRSAALALLGGFRSAGGRALPMLRGGVVEYRDAGEMAARVLGSMPEVRQVGADQSNTSLCIDSMLAFKLFRRLEQGENPELEMVRFLATHTSFRAMPMLRGSLTYMSARGEPATLGIVQDWIESRGDGWSYVVALLRQQDDNSIPTALETDVFSLGAITGRFHSALATESDDPAFAPEPVTSADVERWRQAVATRLLRTTDLIERQRATWPPPARRLGEILLDRTREASVLDQLPDPEKPSSRFRKIRVHGDYHLGQTLKSHSGFVLIDFEGEPARPLAERRAKQPALKDVAGMLRSFDYAVAVARGDSRMSEGDALVVRLLRQRFLDGYSGTLAESARGFVPADPGAVNAWIDFFELEKALYEIEYEMNNRPAWVHIPLRGLVRIVGGPNGQEESCANV